MTNDEIEERVTIDNRRNYHIHVHRIHLYCSEVYLNDDVYSYRKGLKALWIKVCPYIKNDYDSQFKEVDKALMELPTTDNRMGRHEKAYFISEQKQQLIRIFQQLEQIEKGLVKDMQKAKLLLPVSDYNPNRAIENIE